MSKLQTLRAVVTERLTAAAEDIFALFEKTIVEYEKELCHFKEENQRKQQLLDTACNPKAVLPSTGAGVQAPSSPTPGPSLNQNITEIKQEPEELKEEQQTVFVPEISTVPVKTEESSLLQRQTEHREETKEEDISSEPHLHSDTEEHTENSSDSDNDDWKRPLTWSDAPMETEADGSYYTQSQPRDRSTAAKKSGLSSEHKSAPETSATVRKRKKNGTKGDTRNKLQCSFCKKRFKKNYDLQRHVRIHTGERPYKCSICEKTFNHEWCLKIHMRIHNNEKPYSCSHCDKTFNQKISWVIHKRTHTGERPYCCSLCNKTYTRKCSLKRHKRTHTESQSLTEDPVICSLDDITVLHI